MALKDEKSINRFKFGCPSYLIRYHLESRPISISLGQCGNSMVILVKFEASLSRHAETKMPRSRRHLVKFLDENRRKNVYN